MYVVDTNQSRSTIIIAAEFTHKGSVTPPASHYTTLRLPAHYATQPCCSAFQFLVSFILPFSYLVHLPTDQPQSTNHPFASLAVQSARPSLGPSVSNPPPSKSSRSKNEQNNKPTRGTNNKYRVLNSQITT